MLHKLRQDGLTISDLVRRTGQDRKTVRKYLEQGTKTPVYGPRAPRIGVLDPCKDCISKKLTDHSGLSASRLTREIAAPGYAGDPGL